MIQVPYELIVEKIQEKSGLTSEQIEEKIKAKMDLLAGLISREGAAHIIANEYGVAPIEAPKGALKVKALLSGMRNIEVTARVLDIYELREFTRKNGDTGKVKSCLIADETGRTRAVFWGDKTSEIESLKQNDILKIKDGYVKENQGRVEIHVGDRAQIIINPPGEKIQEIPTQLGFVRKQISQLSENDVDVELFGTIVQGYPPTFFEICPQCSRRARPKDGIFVCETHGSVTPTFSCVMNTILDDGTGNIRCAFFRNQVEHLLAKPWDDVMSIKDSPDLFRPIEEDLLGRVIKVGGRASKNAMFERLEFVVQRVLDRNPDPAKEIEALKAQGAPAPESVSEPAPAPTTPPAEAVVPQAQGVPQPTAAPPTAPQESPRPAEDIPATPSPAPEKEAGIEVETLDFKEETIQ